MLKLRLPLHGLVLALIVGMPVRAGEAALPPAPFELRTSPSTVLEGGRFTIEVAPREQEGKAVGEHPFDIYISLLRDAASSWIYLMPSGAWSATPMVYQKQVTGAGLTRFGATFEGVGPIGWYRVRVQFIKASAESPSRKTYVFQPLLATVRIRPSTGNWTRAMMALGPLGLLTLGACVLVLALPRQPLPAPPPLTRPPFQHGDTAENAPNQTDA
ncbi:MAG: hypothetical protein HY725_21495 [Candidatus Rokubacteria bacterium]|nr:hypothetical protein [Candidatus Rokubacteria bacterium]